MMFDEELYWDKQHTFDRLNVSFVVTLTEHFYHTLFPFLTFKYSKLHSDTPHSVGLVWTSDQPDAETST